MPDGLLSRSGGARPGRWLALVALVAAASWLAPTRAGTGAPLTAEDVMRQLESVEQRRVAARNWLVASAIRTCWYYDTNADTPEDRMARGAIEAFKNRHVKVRRRIRRLMEKAGQLTEGERAVWKVTLEDLTMEVEVFEDFEKRPPLSDVPARAATHESTGHLLPYGKVFETLMAVRRRYGRTPEPETRTFFDRLNIDFNKREIPPGCWACSVASHGLTPERAGPLGAQLVFRKGDDLTRALAGLQATYARYLELLGCQKGPYSGYKGRDPAAHEKVGEWEQEESARQTPGSWDSSGTRPLATAPVPVTAPARSVGPSAAATSTVSAQPAVATTRSTVASIPSSASPPIPTSEEIPDAPEQPEVTPDSGAAPPSGGASEAVRPVSPGFSAYLDRFYELTDPKAVSQAWALTQRESKELPEDAAWANAVIRWAQTHPRRLASAETEDLAVQSPRRVIVDRAGSALRASPFGPVIDTLPAGTVVEIKARQGLWFQIDRGGKKGWICGLWARVSR